MINSNLISSGTIIAKVISDLDLKESELRISDMKEWVAEGLLKIGAINQYEHKIVNLPIINNQVKLPCDLYQLGQVAFSLDGNGWLPMRKTTSSFSVNKFIDTNAYMLIQDDKLLPLVKNLFNLTDDYQALQILNNDINIRQTLSALLNNYTDTSVNGIQQFNISKDILCYDTKPGYIITSIDKGFVKVSYSAIYTDSEGMPMIPDMESYKEAIYWYITMKLLYPKKLKGQISQSDYYDIRNSYNFYRKQAYAEAMMPTIDDLTSIKNTWVKLYPEMNEEDTFFEHTGSKQHIYNQSL